MQSKVVQRFSCPSSPLWKRRSPFTYSGFKPLRVQRERVPMSSVLCPGVSAHITLPEHRAEHPGNQAVPNSHWRRRPLRPRRLWLSPFSSSSSLTQNQPLPHLLAWMDDPSPHATLLLWTVWSSWRSAPSPSVARWPTRPSAWSRQNRFQLRGSPGGHPIHYNLVNCYSCSQPFLVEWLYVQAAPWTWGMWGQSDLVWLQVSTPPWGCGVRGKRSCAGLHCCSLPIVNGTLPGQSHFRRLTAKTLVLRVDPKKPNHQKHFLWTGGTHLWRTRTALSQSCSEDLKHEDPHGYPWLCLQTHGFQRRQSP